jgi:hypothetical protein
MLASALPWMATSLTLLAGPMAPAAAPEPEHELTLGASYIHYYSFLRFSMDSYGAELSYRQPVAREGFWSRVLVGGGVRGGVPPSSPFDGVQLPAEAFVRAQLRARVGIWEAVAGPEIGVSGYAALRIRRIPSPLEDAREDALLSPVYVSMGASPVRLHLGRWVLSALEAQVGYSAFPAGSSWRLQVGLVALGGTL